MSILAAEFHWSEKQILKLEAAAAFHYAMRAEKNRWQRFNDMREAASYPHLSDNRDRKAVIERVNIKLAGPGVVVPYEATLSEETKLAMAEADRERDATWAEFQAAGVLCRADGKRIEVV